MNQHINVQQRIDDERIKKQPHHRDFLFHNLFGKIANRAIRLVIHIGDEYLPVDTGQTPKNYTGVTRNTLGIPCIHKIQEEHINHNTPLAMAEFHAHWYLTAPETSPIDPRLDKSSP